jgi:putative DNA-invertase from lambdoid prophage Rac
LTRAGLEQAKQRGDRRKPSYTRDQLNKVRGMLGQQTVGIAQIAKETGLTRQTVYRIKGDPAVLRVLWVFGGCEGSREA